MLSRSHGKKIDRMSRYLVGLYIMLTSFVTIQSAFLSSRLASPCKNLFASSNHRVISMSATDLSNFKGRTLVSLDECLKVYGKGPIFIDGSWFLMGRNARDEYEQGPRIAGAKFFDIDDIASKGLVSNPKGLPHMMPPKKLFAAAMDALSITNTDKLVIYGTQGCMFPHRSVYQLRAMGHDNIHFMQGSLDDWKAAGGPIDEGPIKALSADELDLSKDSQYLATDAQNIVDMEDMKEIIAAEDESDAILVDVRAKNRFEGLVEEPRAGMRLGHMPNAINLPFLNMLNPENVSQFKPKDELEQIFSDAGLDLHTSKRIVCYCGSGASACTMALALIECGRDPKGTFIYDGSWSEWGAEPDTPIIK